MTRRIIEDQGRMYTVSMDDEIPISLRNWAIIKARVVDEITGESPEVPLIITTSEPGLLPKVSSNGLFALAGIPAQVLPDDLSTRRHQIMFRIEAEGYITVNHRAVIGPVPNYPDEFSPLELFGSEQIVLHREPVIIQGRIVQRVIQNNQLNFVPVPGVQIRITKIWRVLENIGDVSASENMNMISLQPPLYFKRETSTDALQGGYMTTIQHEICRCFVRRKRVIVLFLY